VGESNPKPSRTCREHTISLTSDTEIRGESGVDLEISYHINPECNTDEEILVIVKKSLSEIGMKLVPSAKPIPIEYLGPT